MDKRIPYFDFLKGIAIIFVVLIHTMPYVTINEQMDIFQHSKVFFRQLLNIAVPLFLAISGYFAARRYDYSNSKNFIEHFKTNVKTFYFPCMLWSMPYFVIDLAHGIPVACALTSLIICGYSVYYYISLMLQFDLIFYKLKRVNIWGG